LSIRTKPETVHIDLIWAGPQVYFLKLGSRSDQWVGARSLGPAPSLNVMSCIDLALPAIVSCNTPSGPNFAVRRVRGAARYR